MDVHHYNTRLLWKKCSVLVHVALPSTLLEVAGVTINNEYEEWRVSVRTEKMSGERSRIFNPVSKVSTDPSLTKQQCGYVLITSIPLLFSEENVYNGLDVISMRVACSSGGQSVHLRFFYLTFINCLRKYYSTNKSNNNTTDPIDKTPDTFDLILREVADSKKESCEALAKTDPTLYALAGMLDRFNQSMTVHNAGESQSKHHPALENPGLIRSGSVQPNQGPVSHVVTKKANVVVDINSWIPEIMSSANSLLYGVRFWIFLYNGWRWSPEFTDLFHTLPTSTLEQLSPLAGFEARGTFLLRKQVEFVGTLLGTIEKMGGVVNQTLPYYLTGDISSLSSIMIVACQTLILQETESQAWIRAGLSRSYGELGIWCEINDLTPAPRFKCGRDLLFIKRGECPAVTGSEPDWSVVIEHSGIRDALRVQNLFCVAVDEATLAAALILPGGFLIKGHYSLSGEDILFLRRNYGFFDGPKGVPK